MAELAANVVVVSYVIPVISKLVNFVASEPIVIISLSLPDAVIVVRAVSAERSEIVLPSVDFNCSLPNETTTSETILSVSIDAIDKSSIPLSARAAAAS